MVSRQESKTKRPVVSKSEANKIQEFKRVLFEMVLQSKEKWEKLLMNQAITIGKMKS